MLMLAGASVLLPARGNPAPPALIRSLEVTRPRAPELLLVRAPALVRGGAVDAPPACDAAPLALLRTGCPDAAPSVLPCSAEGLECRYPSDGDCVAHHECVYGLWSPVAVACPSAEQDPLADGAGQVLQGTGPCEEHAPVADAPCAEEGLSCGHLRCAIGDQPQLLAECRCGR